jgi:hypothetical protein
MQRIGVSRIQETQTGERQMTNLQAGNARRAEAEAAMAAGNYAAAARDFTLAAEQFEKVWWEMHRTTNSPDAQGMRTAARKAIQLRDAA